MASQGMFLGRGILAFLLSVSSLLRLHSNGGTYLLTKSNVYDRLKLQYFISKTSFRINRLAVALCFS